jgi:phospholipid/cholesterol/gamma-HCH transport system permease protein
VTAAIVSQLPRFIVNSIEVTGEFTSFVFAAFSRVDKLWKRRSNFIEQCLFIGVSSLGIVLVAAFFMGAVLGYQLYVSFHLFGAEALLGGTVGVALFRELGPVIGSIMVTGRAGAAMAAQLASMRISEQIDALEVMAVDPVEYLVTPRIIAGIVMMPILIIFFGIVASAASAWIACGVMDMSIATFVQQFRKMVDVIELVHCLVKSAAFGLVLTSVGCFCGFRARGGASAVGYATRTSVVATCLTILLSDYILTSLLPFGHGGFDLGKGSLF